MTIALSTRAVTLTNTLESSSRVTLIISFNPSIFFFSKLSFQILFRETKMKDSGEYLLLPPALNIYF